MGFKKGYTPWNKGLTKETEPRIKNSWNKGLTKETDPRVKKYSETLRGRTMTEKQKAKQSVTRKERIKSGNIVIWNKGLKGFNPSPETNFKKGHVPWTKGKRGLWTNTGRTHFKKGQEAWNKGKKMSEESKRKLSKSLTGRKLSKEHIKNMGDANRGKKRSEEAKRNISAGLTGRKLSKSHIEKMRKNRVNQIFPSKDTKIEIALQNELNRRNITYKKHIPVYNICQPDMVFPEEKIAIFVDGEYWHSKTFRNGKVWETDRRIDKTLREEGWTVLRFWGREIKKDVGSCVNKIEEVIE